MTCLVVYQPKAEKQGMALESLQRPEGQAATGYPTQVPSLMVLSLCRDSSMRSTVTAESRILKPRPARPARAWPPGP